MISLKYVVELDLMVHVFLSPPFYLLSYCFLDETGNVWSILLHNFKMSSSVLRRQGHSVRQVRRPKFADAALNLNVYYLILIYLFCCRVSSFLEHANTSTKFDTYIL